MSEAYHRLTQPQESEDHGFDRDGMGGAEQPSAEDMREAERLFKKMFGDRSEADIFSDFNASLQRDMSAQLKSAFKGKDIDGQILQFHQEIREGPRRRMFVRTTAVIQRKNGERSWDTVQARVTFIGRLCATVLVNGAQFLACRHSFDVCRKPALSWRD